MPLLLVLFRRSIALALQRADVDDHRMQAVFDPAEGADQLQSIIAIAHKNIIQPQSPEEVARCLPLGLPQQLQVLIQAAVILGNGHIVVIDHDNEVSMQLCRKIQRLQRLSAREGAISNHRNHIPALSLQIPSLGHTAGKADRSRGMTHSEKVMFTLIGVAVTGHIVVVFRIEVGILAASQHLMGIALVRHIKNDLILWGIKHIMQGNGGFHHAEIRAKVAAVSAGAQQQRLAHLLCQHRQLLHGQLFDVRRAVNRFQVHDNSPP